MPQLWSLQTSGLDPTPSHTKSQHLESENSSFAVCGLFYRTFDNVYIGWGLKYSAVPFNPELPPPVQQEVPAGPHTHTHTHTHTHISRNAGPDVTETTDPTVEQEEALHKAQEEAQEAMEGEEEPEESDED